jgi:hypothetical protein
VTLALIYNATNNIDERWWDDESSSWGPWADASLIPAEGQIEALLPEGGAYLAAAFASVIAKADEERHDHEMATAKRAAETLESDYALCSEVTAYIEGALQERFFIWTDYTLTFVAGSSDSEFTTGTDKAPHRVLCFDVEFDLGEKQAFVFQCWPTVRRASASDGPLGAHEWKLQWSGPFVAAALTIEFTTQHGDDINGAETLLAGITDWRYPG